MIFYYCCYLIYFIAYLIYKTFETLKFSNRIPADIKFMENVTQLCSY